jgi:hypothetical protein
MTAELERSDRRGVEGDGDGVGDLYDTDADDEGDELDEDFEDDLEDEDEEDDEPRRPAARRRASRRAQDYADSAPEGVHMLSTEPAGPSVISARERDQLAYGGGYDLCVGYVRRPAR